MNIKNTTPLKQISTSKIDKLYEKILYSYYVNYIPKPILICVVIFSISLFSSILAGIITILLFLPLAFI